MFTECPECGTGFRVTAKVLQQAGGRVRCGGCGHAFSALDHLTEELPSSNIEDDVPQSETDADDLTSDEQLAETSRRLLKTLSELAGPEDVRIEDTGFEWQVLDEDEEKGIAAGAATTEIDAESLEPEDAAEDALEEEHFDDSSTLPDELQDEEAGIATDTGIEELVMDDASPAELEAESDEKPEDWTDLLEEADEDDVAADDIPLEVEEELAAIHNELSAKEDSAPGDLDSQFEMQAEAMGLEISGSHEIANDESANGDTGQEEIAAVAALAEDIATEDGIDQLEKDVAGDEEIPTIVASMDDEEDEEIAADDAPAEEEIELAIVDHDGEAQPEPEHSPDDEVPVQSEEEMTINEQIDQELLAAAAQDQDLRATIIGLENATDVFDENAADVETIIMEGDVVRGAMEREREKEKRERALKRFDGSGNLIDSYMTRRAIRGGRRSTDPTAYGAIVGAVFLVLVLVGQIVHANREALSTSGLFNQTIGPIYRMLGNPVTPEWSITGWQFEATNGSVADNQDVLTIFSRIGNRSEQPLPYPLVHVSLTDRWEEIIGSRVLEPNEYLAGDINPGELVIPGDNFTAVITIEEPSVEATGFKLNVCYRVSPGRVRCATEDFKD